MKQYNMDGFYHRVERDGEWVNLCFSDLTPQEIESLTEDYGADQWKRVALHLAERLRNVGSFLRSEGYV